MVFTLEDAVTVSDFLTDHYAYLCNHIRVHKFYPYMIEKRVLDRSDKEEIEHVVTSIGKAEALLEVVRMRGCAAFEAFMTVLQYDFPHVYRTATGLDPDPPPTDWRAGPGRAGRRSTVDEEWLPMRDMLEAMVGKLTAFNHSRDAVSATIRNFEAAMQENEHIVHTLMDDQAVYEQRLRRADADIEQVKHRLSDVRKELADKDLQLNRLSRQLKEKERDLTHADGEIRRERADSLRYKPAWDEMHRLKAEMSSLQAQLNQMPGLAGGGQQEVNVREVLNLQLRATEAEKAEQAAQFRAADLEQQVSALSDTNAVQAAQIAQLGAELEALAEQKQLTRSEHDALQHDYDKMERTMERAMRRQEEAIRALQARCCQLDALVNTRHSERADSPPGGCRRPAPSPPDSLHPGGRAAAATAGVVGYHFVRQHDLKPAFLHDYSKTHGQGVRRVPSFQARELDGAALRQARLVGGNYTGVFVQSWGGAGGAEHGDTHLPRPGTQILQVKQGLQEHILGDCTGEAAQQVLRGLKDGPLRLESVHIPAEYSAVLALAAGGICSGDCFCIAIRARELPPLTGCLALQHGDLLLVTDTRAGEHQWRAVRLEAVTGRLEDRGLIPSAQHFARILSRPMRGPAPQPPAHAHPYTYVKPFKSPQVKRPVLLFAGGVLFQPLVRELEETYSYERVQMRKSPLDTSDLVNRVLSGHLIHFEADSSGRRRLCIQTQVLLQDIEESQHNLLFPAVPVDVILRLLRAAIYPIVIVLKIDGTNNQELEKVQNVPDLMPYNYHVMLVERGNVSRGVGAVAQMVHSKILYLQEEIIWVPQDTPKVPFQQ